MQMGQGAMNLLPDCWNEARRPGGLYCSRQPDGRIAAAPDDCQKSRVLPSLFEGRRRSMPLQLFPTEIARYQSALSDRQPPANPKGQPWNTPN
jgi:hypothetical protein